MAVAAASVTATATWSRVLRLWLSSSAAALVALGLWLLGQANPAWPLRALAPPPALGTTSVPALLVGAGLVVAALVALAFGELARRRA